MYTPLSANLLLKLANLSGLELIELPLSKDAVNSLLKQANASCNIQLFQAAVRLKMAVGVYRPEWIPNLSNVFLALLYMLSQLPSDQDTQFEKAYMSVFRIVLGVRTQREKMIGILKKIIYSLENIVMWTNSQLVPTKETKHCECLVGKFYSAFLEVNEAQLEAKIEEHVTFILKAKKIIRLIKICHLMEFTLLETSRDQQMTLTGSIQRIYNNPKLSVCIEMMGLLIRIALQSLHSLPPKTITYLRSLIDAGVDKHILSRKHLKEHAEYYLFHMGSQPFFASLSLLYEDSQDYTRVVTEEKQLILGAINRYVEVGGHSHKYSLQDCVFYISLKGTKGKEFPGRDSPILRSLIKHSLLSAIFNDPDNISWVLAKRINNSSEDSLTKTLNQLSLIQMSVVLYYLHYMFASDACSESQEERVTIQDMRPVWSKFANAFIRMSSQRVINILRFLLFDLQLGNCREITRCPLADGVTWLMYSHLHKLIYQILLNLLSLPACELIEPDITAAFHDLHYFYSLIRDTLSLSCHQSPSQSNFEEKYLTTPKVFHCKQCLMISLGRFCGRCSALCYFFLFKQTTHAVVFKQSMLQKQVKLQSKIQEAVSCLKPLENGNICAIMLRKKLSSAAFLRTVASKEPQQQKSKIQKYLADLKLVTAVPEQKINLN